jgi:hypothetical protein
MKNLGFIAALLPSIAFASTVSEYTSQVRWVSRNRQLLYGSPCDRHFTTTGVAATTPVVSTLSCPGYAETQIALWTQTDLATVGELPVRATQKSAHSISVLTGEGRH